MVWLRRTNPIEFGQLILRKVVKTVATRCHIFTLKCTKIDFGWGSVPDPAGSLQCSPIPPSWNKGDLLLKVGGLEKGRRGRAKEGRPGKGGRETKGEEAGEKRKGETRHTNPSLLPASLGEGRG